MSENETNESSFNCRFKFKIESYLHIENNLLIASFIFRNKPNK